MYTEGVETVEYGKAEGKAGAGQHLLSCFCQSVLNRLK